METIAEVLREIGKNIIALSIDLEKSDKSEMNDISLAYDELKEEINKINL